MAIRLNLDDQQTDYYYPGSLSDSRLLHADLSDQIEVLLPQFGQGYVQKIPLRDDLCLYILDHTTCDTLMIEDSGQRLNQSLEFSFHLSGETTGQSVFFPHFGLRMLNIWPAQQRMFKVEVFFKSSAFATYCQAIFERLSPQFQHLIYKFLARIYPYPFGGPTPSSQATFNQMLSGAIAPPQTLSIDQLWSNPDFLGVGHLLHRPMTAEMHQVIQQILSCPYSGRTRRTYLENKVLELSSLKLNALYQVRFPSYPVGSADLDSVYEAGKILARHLNNPPSVDALARQVGLNRLKLNCGFHHVYGVTPFRYLRDCRLEQAYQLLITSELAVEAVAHQVGYTSRSNFATAFRRKFGLNPKAFQLYIRNPPQQWSRAS